MGGRQRKDSNGQHAEGDIKLSSRSVLCFREAGSIDLPFCPLSLGPFAMLMGIS